MHRVHATASRRAFVSFVRLWPLALCLSTAAASAQTAGSLAAFAGSWVGSGTLTRQDGTTERIRCQADYASRDPHSLQQNLRCTSDNTQFNLISDVAESGERLSGDWVETTRNARGTLSGRNSRGTITASVQGPGFSAGVAIAARGNKQSVNIRSSGGDIVGLSMSLTRARR